MAKIIDFRQRIKKLEDRKWDILMAHGEHVAQEQWKKIDAQLDVLYRWWVNTAYATGQERELPFHLRKKT